MAHYLAFCRIYFPLYSTHVLHYSLISRVWGHTYPALCRTFVFSAVFLLVFVARIRLSLCRTYVLHYRLMPGFGARICLALGRTYVIHYGPMPGFGARICLALGRTYVIPYGPMPGFGAHMPASRLHIYHTLWPTTWLFAAYISLYTAHMSYTIA